MFLMLSPRYFFICLLSPVFETVALRITPQSRRETHLSHSTVLYNRRRLANVPKASSPDDHLVTNLPLLDNSKFATKHWAGLLPASGDGDKYFFYWLFAPDTSEEASSTEESEIPLIIWLNGGPACSSMDGLWLENGPFRLTRPNGKEWVIEPDPFSWHKAPAYVLYIDQPVGTGISFTTSGKYPRNDEEVNVDFYYFLKEFFQLHSDKFVASKKVYRKLFFSGESHAGHYIPSMMNYIQKQNAKRPELEIPLAGAAIGNGWIDPMVQYSTHEAAYGKGIIGLAQKRALERKEKECQENLNQGKYSSRVCYSLLDEVISNSQGHGSKFTISQYDARVEERVGEKREFPPGHKAVEAYLGGRGSIQKFPFAKDFKVVLQAVNSLPSFQAGQVYQECTDPPYNALSHQDGLGVTRDVVELLNNDVRMLFFNGIHDLICNHVGNEIAVENFAWKKQQAYQKAPRYGWESQSTGKLAGYMKEFDNLMYLKVLDSGHMVPMDVPEVSLDMLQTFIYKKSFDSYKQLLSAVRKESNPTGANCPVCPTASGSDKDCPVCKECQESQDDTDTQKNKLQDFATKSPLLLVGVAFVSGWLIALCVYCLNQNKSDKVTAFQLSDMEMTETNRGYTDQPEESISDDEEENIFT